MEFRKASEIENTYAAIARIPPEQYNRNYLNKSIYLPPTKIKKALFDYSEVGRILNREFSLVGGKLYDCSTVDLEILRGALFGDYELCILYDYDVPFHKHMAAIPGKKKVMKKIAIILNNYLTLLPPRRESKILEVSDHEDQVQIDTARRAGCECIISSDYHFLSQTEKSPVGITPEAFAKMHNIRFDCENNLDFVDTPPDHYVYASRPSFRDFIGHDLEKIAFGY